MKRIVLAVVVLAILAVPVFAITTNNRVSGNVVSFSTVTNSWITTPNIVTFNSVTKRIRLHNLSTVADCYVDIRCTGTNGKRGYFTADSATVLVPAVGGASPNTVELDFATQNLGFMGKTNQVSSNNGTSGSNQAISYTVIGENADL